MLSFFTLQKFARFHFHLRLPRNFEAKLILKFLISCEIEQSLAVAESNCGSVQRPFTVFNGLTTIKRQSLLGMAIKQPERFVVRRAVAPQ